MRSAKRVNHLRGTTGPLWQRNYYEHVIRNEDDLARTREYVAANPAGWAHDGENPDRTGTVSPGCGQDPLTPCPPRDRLSADTTGQGVTAGAISRDADTAHHDVGGSR